MNNSNQPPAGSPCAAYVDMGTTHTRVWLMRGARITAHVRAKLGIQDVARTGSSAQLHTGLRDLLVQVQADARQNGETEPPAFVAAAGMLTSSLGLAEIPHLPAPAGLTELAAAVQRRVFPEITPTPFLLVPGVRTEQTMGASNTTTDIMRGEETLCVGLAASGMVEPPTVVLNLGSHWKAIVIDDRGRITGSFTSLSGELIHAAQTQTLLASSLPREWPAQFDPAWVAAGMNEQRQSGLARALFKVRLLDQFQPTSPDERFAFLCGAFIAGDFDTLTKHMVGPGISVILAGHPALAHAWQCALEKAGITSRIFLNAEIEQAFLGGLHGITLGHR